MIPEDWTDMGGVGRQFFTTHWSLLEGIQASEGDTKRALIDQLMERYWRPVYCYLRKKGYDNEAAKDFTQGYFTDIVLKRNLIERVNVRRGSFRSLLLHALEQYLIDNKRYEEAKKRIPRERLRSIDVISDDALPAVMDEMSPEGSFNYVWLADLLERSLSVVETHYIGKGKPIHWYVFRDRALVPAVEDKSAPTCKELCAKYGITSTEEVSHMVTTVKRHFKTVLRNHMMELATPTEAVEEELSVFSKFFRL